MPLHHDGLIITDITVQTCSTINPLSKCMLDQKKWHRIEKDLHLGSGWVTKSYVHIKRKREEELKTEDKVIIDVDARTLDTDADLDARTPAPPPSRAPLTGAYAKYAKLVGSASQGALTSL